MVIRVFLFSLLISLNACVSGWVYTDVTTPYCTNMGDVSTKAESSSRALEQINIPRVPGARTIWSSNSIVQTAQDAGFENILYCDHRKFSFLGGLYAKDNIIVYGNK